MKSRNARPGSAAQHRAKQIAPFHPRQQQQHSCHARQNERRAKIGLLHNQQNEHYRNDGGTQQRVSPVAHGIEPRVQKPRQKKHQHQLGNLRRLKGKVPAKADPAMSIVRTGNEEHRNQQQCCDA